MKTIDNFEYIKRLLTFDNPDKFYVIQIMQRNKDFQKFKNISIGKNSHLIKSYYIRSLKDYERAIPEIKAIAEATFSRVYINLNRRSMKTVTGLLSRRLIDYMLSDSYDGLFSAFSSTVGEHVSEPWHKWIIDIDPDEGETSVPYKRCEEILHYINSYCLPAGADDIYLGIVETVNGYHIITEPFNSLLFVKKYPDINIHKNNYTLLYFKN